MSKSYKKQTTVFKRRHENARPYKREQNQKTKYAEYAY